MKIKFLGFLLLLMAGITHAKTACGPVYEELNCAGSFFQTWDCVRKHLCHMNRGSLALRQNSTQILQDGIVYDPRFGGRKTHQVITLETPDFPKDKEFFQESILDSYGALKKKILYDNPCSKVKNTAQKSSSSAVFFGERLPQCVLYFESHIDSELWQIERNTQEQIYIFHQDQMLQSAKDVYGQFSRLNDRIKQAQTKFSEINNKPRK